MDVGHDLVLDKVEEIMRLAKLDVGARVSIRIKRQVICAVGAGRSEIRSPTEVVDVFAGRIANAYNYGACAVCEFQAAGDVDCCEEVGISVYEVAADGQILWLRLAGETSLTEC